jgi:hypothetical protein
MQARTTRSLSVLALHHHPRRGAHHVKAAVEGGAAERPAHRDGRPDTLPLPPKTQCRLKTPHYRSHRARYDLLYRSITLPTEGSECWLRIDEAMVRIAGLRSGDRIQEDSARVAT